MAVEIPTVTEIRAIVREAVEPLRDEIARLRAVLDDDTVSLAEAARKLGSTTRTLQRRIKRGELAAVKGGRGFRVRRGDLVPHAEDLAEDLAPRARRG
ncbi:MAG: excisionase family DNA-binding protein [Anaeromyxobacteraceae bacterium]